MEKEAGLKEAQARRIQPQRAAKKNQAKEATTTTSANNQDSSLFILPSKVENSIMTDE